MKVCTVVVPLLDTGRITTSGQGGGEGHRNGSRDEGHLHDTGQVEIRPASYAAASHPASVVYATAFGTYPKAFLPQRR